MSSREIGKITSVGIHGVIADVNSDLGNYINTIDGILFVKPYKQSRKSTAFLILQIEIYPQLFLQSNLSKLVFYYLV